MPMTSIKPSRALFLARVVLGMPVVRQAGRFAAASLAASGAGVAAFVLLRKGGAGPPLAAGAGILVAALAGAVFQTRALRALRTRQASEFARAARRLGEERTALSELRAACRRMALALEGSVPEVLAEDDSSGPWLVGSGFSGDDNGVERTQRLAERIQRVASTAAFFGGKDLDLRRLALAGPCAEVIEQYRRRAGSDQEILYMEDGGGDWLAAPIDRPLFVLAVRELLDNVLEHADGWERITVTTEPVAGAILLRVRDDGGGISPETVAGILSGRTGAAAGLGLALVRAIVEAHGGSMRLESEPGRGTAVSLKFPTHS